MAVPRGSKHDKSSYPMSSRAPHQYERHSRHSSPPRTPPHSGRYTQSTSRVENNGMLTSRPSFPETFLDDFTPVGDGREYDAEDDEPDSHDLSLSPQHAIRTSVVDNMLLSLDQFSEFNGTGDSTNYRSAQEPDPYILYSRYSASKPDGRHRGHTFSSSISSDVDAHMQERAPRYSEQSSRGRRSNSSSNFPPDIVRTRDGPSNRGGFTDTHRATNKGDRALPKLQTRYETTEERNSDLSNVDVNRFLAESRAGRSKHHRRSASLDCATRVKAADSRKENVGLSGSQRPSQDHALRYDDLDAAPTPTVPAGPRKNSSPVVDTSSNNNYNNNSTFYNRPPAPSRKSSAKSSKSIHTKKGRSETIGTSTIRGQADNNFDHFRAAVDDIPPMPSYAQPTAPSPTITQSKSAYFNTGDSTPPPPPKERPGFFRRVFGSSKNPPPVQPTRDSLRSRENESFHQSKGSNGASHSSKNLAPSPMDKPSASSKPSRENMPVVTKKPSSFFRRRKKSTVDHAPPPLVLSQSNHNLPDLSKSEQQQQQPQPRVERLKLAGTAPEPSPVSSLRKVMKPYLADDVSSEPRNAKHYPDGEPSIDDADTEDSSTEMQDSQEKADPNLKARAFAQWSHHNGMPHQRSTQATNSKPGTRDTRASKHDGDDSFLADSSGNEAPNTEDTDERHRRPKTSPTVPNHHSRHRSFDRKQSAPDSVLQGNANGSTLQVPLTPSAISSSTAKEGHTYGKAPAVSSMPPGRSYHDGPKAGRPATNGEPAAMHTGKDWLEPNSSTEQLDESSKMVLPIEGTPNSPQPSVSTVSHYHTASNTPIVPADDGVAEWSKPAVSSTAQRSADVESGADDDNDKVGNDAEKDVSGNPELDLAQKLYDAGGEEATENEPTAAWLGSPDRAAIRKAFMDLFDWSDMNILAALQSLCSRIALKGEAQQVDRVLDAFSTRWCECNSNHGFKATDVVHTICYSLLLLNTDLHLADIEQKMTRTQFIRNTMPTIQRVVADAAPDAFESTHDPNKYRTLRAHEGLGSAARRSQTFPNSRRPSVADSETDSVPISNLSASNIGVASDAGPLVTTPFHGTMKAWEVQVEAVLKDFYNSIQKQKLPLRGVNQENEEPSQNHNNNFLTITGNFLRRTPSTLSKQASENNPRGRHSDQRPTTGRWSSKPRARPRVYPASTMGSSRTSLDDQSSVFSPTASSTWSKNSLGKTLTSMSVDSFASDYPRGDYQQSIGFANALSQAIIREDSASVISAAEDPERAPPMLEDDSLELAGAPWAKEGSLKHKHHLDAVDKRSKDRNWNENFAVIQRGWMRLFNFNSSSKSMRLKAKQRQKGAVVGGGNWTENAEETWKFILRQTIASALPPPGYSKSRPHVWALSLPTGAVHLFQVGTAEIVKEFVSTVNYWSARLSKEPLSGGISNIEYGWGDAVINSALANADEPKKNSQSGARPSIQSSIRGSLDQQGVRPRLPADRINISDWAPPQQSMLATSNSESEQLEALRNYVKNVEEELQRHNELRGPLVLAFTPKHTNANKALANWERKSSYLLREIVKFRTYIDCLQNAQVQKEKILGPSSAENKEEEGSSADGPNAVSVSAT